MRVTKRPHYKVTFDPILHNSPTAAKFVLASSRVPWMETLLNNGIQQHQKEISVCRFEIEQHKAKGARMEEKLEIAMDL